MTRKKGVSIGAAMKQRMGNHSEPDTVSEAVSPAGPEQARNPTPVAQVDAPTAVMTTTPDADPLESFNTRLPRSLQRRLKIHVALGNTKIQDVLHTALNEYLKKHGH